MLWARKQVDMLLTWAGRADYAGYLHTHQQWGGP